MDPTDWAQRKQAGAETAWLAADEALQRVRELLKSGDERKARDAAVTFAVLCDKSGVLEAAALRVEDRRVVLAENQARAMVEIVRAFLQAIDIPLTAPVRGLLAALMGAAANGGPYVAPQPVVEAARRDIGLPSLRSVSAPAETPVSVGRRRRVAAPQADSQGGVR